MSKKKRKNKTGEANPVGAETSDTQTQTSEATATSIGESVPGGAVPDGPAPVETPSAPAPQATEPQTGDAVAPVEAPPSEAVVETAAETLSPADELTEHRPESADAVTAEGRPEPTGSAEGLHLSASDEQPLDGEDVAEALLEVGEGVGELSTERVVEAILFTSDTPLTLPKIVGILGTGSAREVRKIIQGLNKEYAKIGNSFRIEEIAGGFQMLTMPEYNAWLRRLRQSRQDSKLSPAAMETLAVIAYKQPVVRAEVESIRGVSAGETLNRLRELGLVKIVGRAEDVGRPMLYGTTKHFLEVFGLSSLEDLPAVEELQAPK